MWKFRYRHTIVHMWSLEDKLGCWSPSFILFETQSLTACHCVCQANWPQSFRQLSCICLPSYHRSPRITNTCYNIQLYIGSGDPHAVFTLEQQALYLLSHLTTHKMTGSSM